MEVVQPNKSALLTEKIYFFIITGFVISLFLPFRALNHVLAFLLVFPGFLPKGKNFFGNASEKNRYAFLLLVLYFLMYAVGYFFSANKSEALGATVVRLPFVLFPLAFFKLSPQQGFYIKIIKVYAISCLLIAITCLAHRGYLYLLGNVDINYFYNDGLLEIIQKKSVIFSSYISFGILISCYLFLNSQISRLEKGLYAVTAGFLFVFLFLIAVRTALLITFAILVFGTFIALVKQKKFILTMASILLLVFTFIGLINLFPQTKSRFESINSLQFDFKNQNRMDVFWAENSDKNWNGLNLRLAKWICALDVVKANPIFGVGTGDVKDEMVEAYKARDFYYAAEQRFDPHNLYLDIAVGAGLVGLLVFAVSVFYSLRIFWQRENWLALAFMFLFLVSSLTESTLRSRDAVVFYAFFWCFFLIIPSAKPINE